MCSSRRLVGSDLDSCKGYPVSSRRISTLLFHLYHEFDSNPHALKHIDVKALPHYQAPCKPLHWSMSVYTYIHTLNHNLIISLPTCMQLQNSEFNHFSILQCELVCQQYRRFCSKDKLHVWRHLNVCAFDSISIWLILNICSTPLHFYRNLLAPHLPVMCRLFFCDTHTHNIHKLTTVCL